MTEPAAGKAANSAFSRISVAPLAGALGAEITGVDIAAGIHAEAFAEIHSAGL